jgi:hypothetical protein
MSDKYAAIDSNKNHWTFASLKGFIIKNCLHFTQQLKKREDNAFNEIVT